MNCPRCKKETDKLTGSAEGYYDKVTQQRWASAECITGKNDLICESCYEEIRMQDPKYVEQMKAHQERQEHIKIIQAFHSLVNLL